MRKFLTTLAVLAAVSFSARGQFYTPGTDPGNLRWYSLESPYYKVIYPEGADSLARSYARLLEQFRAPVGRSFDQLPQSGRWNKKMPVVLHTHHLIANGSVAYAPERMDLFTTPDSYGSDPVSWPIQLASHEPRHQAQLERTENNGAGKGLRYVLGQGAAPFTWLIYLARLRGEGDAVATETGVAYGTRARTADFLNYMRVALDQGDWRNLTLWSNGSYKNFTPDYYKPGYVLVAGARYLNDWPTFVKDGIDVPLKEKFWMVAPFDYNQVLKARSGKKTPEAFQDALHAFNDVWQEDYKARAPFQSLEPLTPAESFPLIFSSLRDVDGTLYALREGYLRSRELVCIREDGTVQPVRAFSAQSSRFTYDSVRQRLYWSEVVPNPRWSLAGTSPIRYMDLKTRKVKDLVKGKRYFNPQPSADGTRLAVTEYVPSGETYLVVLSADDGTVIRRQEAPRGVQLTESAWQQEVIYCAGISEDGYGIYRALPSGEWEVVLAPSHQKLVNLESGPECLEWVSDRTGVNELYRYSLADASLTQLTNTRYGATDFCRKDGQLYCLSQTREGKLVFRVAADGPAPRKVQFTDLHSYVIEDALTRQEQSLGPAPDLTQEVPLSAPKRYNKMSQALRLHTWLPVYFNVDDLLNGSFDISYENVSPGLTGFFQNTLSTFSGQVGAAIHPDPDQDKRWRAAFHTKLTYTGWFPTLEAKLDVGDRLARQYNYTEIVGSNTLTRAFTGSLRNVPLVNASLRAYVPLYSRKGGLYYGFVPQINYSFSNNLFDLRPVRYVSSQPSSSSPGLFSPAVVEKSKYVFSQTLRASARGYVMLPTATSQIYPRWGVGLEAGFTLRPWNVYHFRPVAFGYTYAYLPGILRNQGLKLTGTVQHQLGQAVFGDLGVGVLPRGFDSASNSYLASYYRTQWKLTADYAIPIYLGDLAVPMVGYIRNFLLTPHADYLGLGKDCLWSVGADLVAAFGEISFLTLNIDLGVSYSYMGGNIFDKTEQTKRHSVSLILSFDI